MPDDVIVVERLVAAEPDIDMRECAWEFALDQRAFGPRRVLVALTDRSGRLLEIAHADRTDPPEFAFGLCLHERSSDATVALAYCDEPVDMQSSPEHLADLARRLADARWMAQRAGVHLVDWFACDDQAFRSFRFASEPDSEWWDAP